MVKTGSDPFNSNRKTIMNNKIRNIWLVSVVLFLYGCDDYEYHIEMTPENDTIVRTISCSKNFAPEFEEKLKGFYTTRIDAKTYSGIFLQNLPDDVGGFGRYFHLRNPMGEISIYSERFRGKDDQAAVLEDMFRIIDHFVVLAQEWTKMELGRNPNYAKLQEFITLHLGNDMKNMLLYAWLTTAGKGGSEEETAMRLLHYFYERNYFTFEDISWLTTSLPTMEEEEWILACIKCVIARKMGYASEEEIAEELHFLTDENSLSQSALQLFNSEHNVPRILKRAEVYKEPNTILRLADIMESASDPNEALERVLALYEIDFEAILDKVIVLHWNNDKVTVKLNFPQKPSVTNGKWDEEKKQVYWSSSISTEDLPVLCYATFAVPDDVYQKNHLGKTLIQEDDLLEYSFWYNGLSNRQQEEWNEWVGRLKGDDTVLDELRKFRFTDLPAGRNDKGGKPCYLTDVPLEIIAAGTGNQSEGAGCDGANSGGDK